MVDYAPSKHTTWVRFPVSVFLPSLHSGSALVLYKIKWKTRGPGFDSQRRLIFY